MQTYSRYEKIIIIQMFGVFLKQNRELRKRFRHESTSIVNYFLIYSFVRDTVCNYVWR